MCSNAEDARDLRVRGADRTLHVRSEAEHGAPGKAQVEHTIHVVHRVDRQSSSGVLATMDEDYGDRRRLDGSTRTAST